ncbi:MAG: Ldh family oxidoreductase [Candidatus Bathyarchaeia archaeon]
MPTFSSDQLRKLCIKMFQAVDASDEQAEVVTEILLDTSLFGIDSHGVRAVPGHIKSVKSGRIRADAEITVLKDTLTTALWSSLQQFGHVVGKKAMESAIKKAEKYGMGWVSTVTPHIGALYYYSLMAAKKDMIGIVTCRTTNYRTTPYGGKEGRLGTNPISICIPAYEEKPILLDMATSIAAAGHIAVMGARGEKVPEGWLLDKNGNSTTDPNDYTLQGGLLTPFGAYKGYGLSIIIQALPDFIPGIEIENERSQGITHAHTFMALDPAGFMPLQDYKKRTDALIRYIKSCPPLPGRKVQMPFDREWSVRERRVKEGIPVDELFWKRFIEVGNEIGIDVNKEMDM